MYGNGFIGINRKTASGSFSISVEQSALEMPAAEQSDSGIQIATARKIVDRGRMQEVMDAGYSKADAMDFATIQQQNGADIEPKPDFYYDDYQSEG